MTIMLKSPIVSAKVFYEGMLPWPDGVYKEGAKAHPMFYVNGKQLEDDEDGNAVYERQHVFGGNWVIQFEDGTACSVTSAVYKALFVTNGKCPECEGWGAPTGCKTCRLTCMGG